jgi:integrase
MDLVIRPKPETFIANYYSNEEASKVINISKNSLMELPVLFAAFYGLRRSEIVGLKWDCFNFDEDVFMIRHTVTAIFLDGHITLIEEDRAKSEASIRSLPLVAPVKERLLTLREQQKKYRRLCGKSYNTDFLDYVCVDQAGNRIKPNYITCTFTALLAKAKMRIIRFHDLRHTCASLLLANGVSLKDIQAWLGHSDIQTTARYAHVDMRNKKASANTMLNVISLQ